MKLKKLFIFLFCFLLNFLSVSAKETGNLYLIKNIPERNLVNIINSNLPESGYNIVSGDDFYIIPSKAKPADFYEILLEQDGPNCYMYYASNIETNSLDLTLIKEFKKGHYGVKKIEMTELDRGFIQKAALLKQKCDVSFLKAQNYDFGDDSQEAFDKRNNIPVSYKQPTPSSLTVAKSNYIPIPVKTQQFQNQAKKQLSPVSSLPNINSQKVLKGTVVTVASGTVFDVALESAVSSGSLEQSDKITAVLNEDFTYNGYLIMPKETILYGNAIKANAATGGYGNGNLELIFNQALLPSGNKINLSLEKITYAKNSERMINITRDVVVGTGVGVLGGLLSAALTGDYSRALIMGASLGAAGGGIHAATQKGEEIEIPEGTILNMRLTQPINISPYN